MRGNPIYPASWDPPGGPRNAMFDIGARVKYIGESLSFLPHGSLGTVVSHGVNVNNLKPDSTYLTYNVCFDGSQQVYWFLARELASGYQTNPVYPAEWEQAGHRFMIGDRVSVVGKPQFIATVSGYAVKPGVIWIKYDGNLIHDLVRQADLEYANPTTPYRENSIGLDSMAFWHIAGQVHDSYQNNPIYPAHWEEKFFKVGQVVQVVNPELTKWYRRRGRIIQFREPSDGIWYLVGFGEKMQEKAYMRQEDITKTVMGYDPNPIYPAEWPQRDFQAGDYVIVTSPHYPVWKGVITCVTAAGKKRFYDIRSDAGTMYNMVDPSEMSWTGERRKYRNNQIYPADWHMPVKKGDHVVIEDGSTYAQARMRIGTVTYVGKDKYAYVTLWNTGRSITRHVDDLRLATKQEEKEALL